MRQRTHCILSREEADVRAQDVYFWLNLVRKVHLPPEADDFYSEGSTSTLFADKNKHTHTHTHTHKKLTLNCNSEILPLGNIA